MKISQNNRKSLDLPYTTANETANWSEHEHVAETVNQEARHLVQMAGSPELAKQAIDSVEDSNHTMPMAAKEELARDLGYPNSRVMLEQTEIVNLPSGSFVYLTTDSDGFWVAWSDKPYYDLQRFESRQQALTSLREDAEFISLQS